MMYFSFYAFKDFRVQRCKWEMCCLCHGFLSIKMYSSPKHTQASQCVGSCLAFWFSCWCKICPRTAHFCLLFRWCSASIKPAPRQHTASLLILLPNWNSPQMQHSTDPCLPLRKLEVVIAANGWTGLRSPGFPDSYPDTSGSPSDDRRPGMKRRQQRQPLITFLLAPGWNCSTLWFPVTSWRHTGLRNNMVAVKLGLI